jgi:hypothetical protein
MGMHADGHGGDGHGPGGHQDGSTPQGSHSNDPRSLGGVLTKVKKHILGQDCDSSDFHWGSGSSRFPPLPRVDFPLRYEPRDVGAMCIHVFHQWRVLIATFIGRSLLKTVRKLICISQFGRSLLKTFAPNLVTQNFNTILDNSIAMLQ